MDELYSVIMESSTKLFLHEFLYAIWCHLYDLKNVKNTQGRVLLLVKLKLFCGCLTCFFYEIVKIILNRSRNVSY